MTDKILLVDDDANLLMAMRRNLESRFSLDTANSGLEALDKLDEGGPYAVIVSDLRMPGMDGITLLDKVRQRAPDTIRMVLTGYADMDTVIEAVNEGYIFRFLAKPCSVQVIAKAIEDALTQYRLVMGRQELMALRQLKDAFESVVMGFGRLVEARDPYTAGHQRRVAQLGYALAREMGLDASTREAVRIASLIHDVGKIYVPAEFLNRPGRLSEVEFAVIRSHPQVGYDIMKPLDSHWPLSELVYQHHERLDGSGYPRGLAGDDILMEARVISVADVVEAMASHRPYRPSRGLDGALDEIRKNAGTLYDRDVVEVCLRLFERDNFTFEEQEKASLT